jgi:hypothetical protein
MSKASIRDYSAAIIIHFGALYILSTLSISVAIIFDVDPSKIFLDEVGDSTIGFYQMNFWLALGALDIFMIFGGTYKGFINIFKKRSRNDE